MPEKNAVDIQSPIWQHAKHVTWRKVGDEAVILDMDSAIYYSIEDPGLRIWELIGEGKSVEAIVGLIIEEYDGREDEVRKDIDQLVKQLQDEGIIERSDSIKDK